MAIQVIKFPVVSFRKIQTPYEEDESKKTLYVAVIKVKDIPVDLAAWTDINPRDPNVKSKVSEKIRDSLIASPSAFLFKNRGLTVLAKDVSFDNQDNTVAVEMSDEKLHGLLDGGHTFKVITDHLEAIHKDGADQPAALIKVELLQGFSDLNDAVDIVEARNTSAQVKDQSIEELRGHFDRIKNALVGTNYADRVAYSENELMEDGGKKDLDIKEILSYLVCFDVEMFNHETHPVKAYSSKGAVFNQYKAERDRMEKYLPLLPEILALRDVIYRELPDAYNHGETDKKKKFGGLTGVDGESITELPFIGEESHYYIPAGFIYPVLAAFRPLVRCEGNMCDWQEKPETVFARVKNDLASRVGSQAKELRNPNKLGKDKATWSLCYDCVRMEVLTKGLN